MFTDEDVGYLLRALAIFAIVLLALSLAFVVPGLLAGRPLFGTPNRNPIFSSGGFHCPGDGPYRIHYHTCNGPAYSLPDGTSPDDYPEES